MKKWLIYLIGVLLICFTLVGCSSNTSEDTQSAEDEGTVNSSEDEPDSWETFLSSIHGEDIGSPNWSIYRENPTNDELAQCLQSAASSQTDSSDDVIGEILWTLEMYVDAPPDDELNRDHILSLDAGFQENLVRISGGDTLPNGIFFVDDSDLYWMVRSMYDYPTTIDEAALAAYQDMIDQYIADEQSSYGNPAVTVELLSLENSLDRSDIGVEVYTVGTVLTSDSPKELMQYRAGGAYFDSQLRLHPDGNSARSNMLVIDGTPVGFLNWEALDAITSQDISSSDEVMKILLNQGVDWFKAI